MPQSKEKEIHTIIVNGPRRTVCADMVGNPDEKECACKYISICKAEYKTIQDAIDAAR